MKRDPLHILMIGPLPPPVGGTTVLFKRLGDSLCDRDDVTVSVIGSSGVRGRGPGAIPEFCGLAWRILQGVRRCDVVALHASTSGVPIIGPFVACLTRIWRRPLILRKFGGTGFDEFPFVLRVCANWTVRCADLFLVETKALVKRAQAVPFSHVAWYANSREIDRSVSSDHVVARSCRRFIFLSQVRPSKGIAELIVSGERFDDDVQVDVYGPFLDGLSEETFAGLQNVHYRGVVGPDAIHDILRDYDAVVLPTKSRTEGYPGTVIEAYCAGIPVITTRCGAIPEIVDESCGLLIEPGDAEALHQAMKAMVDDDALYADLCRGALLKRDLFDSDIWTERFIDHCKQLAGTPRDDHS